MFVVMHFLCLILFSSCADAEFYEDRRCSCVCPALDVDENKSRGVKMIYQDNHVSPEECNCNDMVLPRIVNKLNGSQRTYCLQCYCRFETRNTTFVMIVVISLLAFISTLMLHMGCVYILHTIFKHRTNNTTQRLDNEEQLLILLNDVRPDASDEDN